MLRYALTIFLSAFLLFQVQPLISKYILPWFGGTPAVWTTCMLFFQVLLLGGYAYAHVVATALRQRRQVVVHLVVLGAAVATLPILPSARWKPAGLADPTWHILALLAVTVGLPYFVLATTSPLLQAWFHRTHPGRRPYRLYALSNAGSLLALLSYPFAVEPRLASPDQAWAWSLAFLAFAALCAATAVRTWHVGTDAEPGMEAEPRQATAAEGRRPGVLRCLLWVALAACGSVLLLAVTNQMCQDVAVVPFLWVLPLSLYLLTFIICFESERWYVRPVFWVWMACGMVGMVGLMEQGVDASIQSQVVGYSAGLFGCVMVCHGELVRLKPAPRHLTLFYLMVSAGGALGGVFVTLVAPLVFDAYLELHVGLWACGALAVLALWMDKRPFLHWPRSWWARLGVPVLVLAPLLLLLVDPSQALGRVEDAQAARYTFALWAEGALVLGVLWWVSWGDQRGLERLAVPLFAFLPIYLVFGHVLARPFYPLVDLEEVVTAERVFGAWSLAAALAFGVWVDRRARAAPRQAGLWMLSGPALAIALVFLGQRLRGHAEEIFTGSETVLRNFYGVLRVTEYDAGDPDLDRLVLRHGRISHGCQLLSQEGCTRPTTYYWEETGVGLAIRHHPRRDRGLHVGVVGLGTGTVAAYGRVGDRYRFYEINPAVRRLATERFTYLSNSEAACTVVLGDARLSMEGEPPQGFDVLVLDAFSGDAIPVHLLTREAFGVYLRHLRPQGVIAVHISNRYLELEPVCWALADALALDSALIESSGDSDLCRNGCTWVLLSRNGDFLRNGPIAEAASEVDPEERRRTVLWTDTTSNLFRILR